MVLAAGARVFDDSMVRAMRAVALEPSLLSERKRWSSVNWLLGCVGQYFHHYIVNWVRVHDAHKSAPDYCILAIPFLCMYSNRRRNAVLNYSLYRDYSTKKRGILEGLLTSIHRWLLEVNRKHVAAEGLQLPAKIDFDPDDAYEAVVRP